jgi:hypothetical protein
VYFIDSNVLHAALRGLLGGIVHPAVAAVTAHGDRNKEREGEQGKGLGHGVEALHGRVLFGFEGVFEREGPRWMTRAPLQHTNGNE